MTTLTITHPDTDLRDRITSVLDDAAQFDGVAEAEYGVTSEQRAERESALEALRKQVQQDRDTYYEQACELSEMAGHEVQEARASGRVAAYDEVLRMLAGGGDA